MCRQRPTRLAVLLGVVALQPSPPARAAVIVSATGTAVINAHPFTGEYRESWEAFPDFYDTSEVVPEQSRVFGDAAYLTETHNLAIIYRSPAPYRFTLGDVKGQARVADGTKAMSIAVLEDTGCRFLFDRPILRFGGYFNAAGSGADDLMTFLFRDHFGVGEPRGASTADPDDTSDMQWLGWSLTRPAREVYVLGPKPVMDSLRASTSWQTGDVDLDGIVGPGDFNILATNFGKTVQYPFINGDLNGDRIVGPEDFNLLASHFGEGVGNDAGLVSDADRAAVEAFGQGIIPEPAGASAVACVLAAAWRLLHRPVSSRRR
jgi:hypothetical protein